MDDTKLMANNEEEQENLIHTIRIQKKIDNRKFVMIIKKNRKRWTELNCRIKKESERLERGKIRSTWKILEAYTIKHSEMKGKEKKKSTSEVRKISSKPYYSAEITSNKKSQFPL